MKKQCYETPTIDVISVAIEQGIATTGGQQKPSGWQDIV